MKSRLKRIMVVSMQEIKKELLYLSYARRPKKILFDHLPKCGGSSVNKYLEAHYPRRKTFSTKVPMIKASVDKFKNLSISQRYGYDLVKGHGANQLLDYVHPECLKVTVLREPIDRIVSHYYYARRTPRHYLYSKIHESEMSLEDYVTLGISGELRNYYTTRFSGLTADDAEKKPNESINRAVEAILKTYDVVGFLDSFSSFADALREQARLRYKWQGEKQNVTEGRIAINDIQQSIISKIEQINHLDVVLYRKIKKEIDSPVYCSSRCSSPTYDV